MAEQQQPSHAVSGAQIVGKLLKFWPAKEAPLLIQIAFYEELQRAVVPYAGGEERQAKWFKQLDRVLSSDLVVLRRLAVQQVRESEKARNRLDGAINKVPSGLRRVLRQARS